MSEVKETIRLIQVNPNKNSNKFWNGTLYEDGSYFAEWGRVGAKGQSGTYQGESKFRRKISEKERKGYVEQKTLNEGVSTTIKNHDVHSIVKDQIKVKSKELETLLETLINENIHQITTNTQIKYDTSSGVFQTPLGIVTKEGLDEASDLLDDIFALKIRSGSKLYDLGSEFLSIVPQKVGKNVRDFIDETFTTDDSIRDQKSLLDSLRVSFDTVNASNPSTSSDSLSSDAPKVFDVELDILKSGRELNRLIKKFESSKKSMHNYGSVGVKNIYKVRLNEMHKNFDSKPWGNVKEYFHGTGIANCLSILKSGLKVAPPSTAAIAGKMFGNGTYGSECSTKALGYSKGRWGQGGSYNSSGWLFVCDFAMGKEYFAKSSFGSRGVPSGYDSCQALPQNTGLYNHEAIVYNNHQVNIKYLIETN